MTQGERLAKIEVLLQTNAETSSRAFDAIKDMDERLTSRLDKMEAKHEQTAAELEAFKNKGAGILIGVGIAATAAGASIATGFKWLFDLVN